MTDLTELWKKGELTGEYWCEITESPYPERVYLPTCDKDIIVEVLAPVPSYEEYQKLLSDQLAKNEGVEINAELEAENAKLKEEYKAECHRSDELEDSYWKAEKENAQLKELLKECRNILNEQNFYRNTPIETDMIYRTRCLKKQELLTKINEVLK